MKDENKYVPSIIFKLLNGKRLPHWWCECGEFHPFYKKTKERLVCACGQKSNIYAK